MRYLKHNKNKNIFTTIQPRNHKTEETVGKKINLENLKFL